jgi:hypothetical protein
VLEDIEQMADAETGCCRPGASASASEGAGKVSLPAACC